MNILEHIDSEHLHHAYVIEDAGDTFTTIPTYVRAYVENPELYVREFATLGINDSRELIRTATMRSVGTQIFIYKAGSLTREAQNALLKLFEEPPARTHFFLCVASVGDLVPTLLSRVHVIGSNTHSHTSARTKEFLSATAGARIALLESMIKDKDTAAAEALLRDVEHELYERKAHLQHPAALAHVLQVREVLHDKGVSLKALLESTALVLPTIH